MPVSLPLVLKFRAATLTNVTGRSLRLHAVSAGKSTSSRRPFCLTLTAAGEEIALELTRREAIALSEWLDEAVTHVK